MMLSPSRSSLDGEDTGKRGKAGPEVSKSGGDVLTLALVSSLAGGDIDEGKAAPEVTKSLMDESVRECINSCISELDRTRTERIDITTPLGIVEEDANKGKPAAVVTRTERDDRVRILTNSCIHELDGIGTH